MIVGITGGTGYVGTALVLRHLEKGDSVRILSRRHGFYGNLSPSIRWFRGDLLKASPADLESFADGVDVLYHCAAEIVNPEEMYGVNVTGAGNLCKAASGRIGRWVQLSSVGVYGPHEAGTITENTPCSPLGCMKKPRPNLMQLL